MTAAWTHFRRLVASLMLVAMTSFVLHSGAMAGLHQHGLDSSECETTASSGHVHQAAVSIEQAHDHDNVAAHHHGTIDSADEVSSNDTKADPGAKTPCCTSVCAVVLTSVNPAAMSAPMGIILTLLPESQLVSGIDPNGLKRPPRTPDIA